MQMARSGTLRQAASEKEEGWDVNSFFALGKNDEVTYKLMPTTGEVDLCIDHEDGERLVIRFLESEAVELFKATLERMQASLRLADNRPLRKLRESDFGPTGPDL